MCVRTGIFHVCSRFALVSFHKILKPSSKNIKNSKTSLFGCHNSKTSMLRLLESKVEKAVAPVKSTRLLEIL
jgi:5-methylcytosine-specific restriction endonuclease McrA